MDYCTACRRHLNGALCCPGCGTSSTSGTPSGPTVPFRAPAPTATPAHAGQQPYGQPAHEPPGRAGSTSEQPGPEPVPPRAEEPRPQGSRAATAPSRGRRARGRQRGVVVLSVAGLVVGGIGAMAMAVMGGPEGGVAPAGPTDPGHSASVGDAVSGEASAHATTVPVSPVPSADPHRSSKPSAPASSASPSASTGPTTAPTTPPATRPAASPTAPPSAPSPTAPATTGPATPTRSAGPSPTCKPVLFWCA
ncbi:SCO2400 family protein [Kitasatospora phosalacinea]|uniref:SCO2400 family protein n=1 Tax=Kitasatospora phosalacinea TaxID=2065 RepID=UPI0025561FC8|nr:hypothetical protein [Kitasatospora phosalacinea]